jgi:hypothetical protein
MANRKTVDVELFGETFQAFADGGLDMRIFDAAEEHGYKSAPAIKAIRLAFYGEDGYQRICDISKERRGFVSLEDIAAAADAAFGVTSKN